MQKTHEERLNGRKIDYVNVISFFMGLSTATLAYIISSYLKESLGTDNVSLFYFSSYIAVLALLLNLHKLIRRFGKSNVFFMSIAVKVYALVVLSFLEPSFLSPLFLSLYIISGSVAVVCLDVILESFSVDRKSGRIRGMHLMILDIGFIFGPFLSTQILANYSYQTVFLASFLIEFFILAFAIANLRRINHVFREDIKVMDVLVRAFKKRNVLRIYYISVILEFFYALMIIYSPIYLRGIGLSWEQIGLIFTIMLVPFVILPYPVGYLADKKLGEKELLIFAVFMMSAATSLIFLINNSNLIVWAFVLFMTRIGAAMIQTLRDSYFYKRIDGNDVDLIDFFRTAVPVAYISASAISFGLLIFFPTRYVFLLLAAVAFSALYPALRLADNKSEEEIAISEKKLLKKLA